MWRISSHLQRQDQIWLDLADTKRFYSSRKLGLCKPEILLRWNILQVECISWVCPRPSLYLLGRPTKAITWLVVIRSAKIDCHNMTIIVSRVLGGSFRPLDIQACPWTPRLHNAGESYWQQKNISPRIKYFKWTPSINWSLWFNIFTLVQNSLTFVQQVFLFRSSEYLYTQFLAPDISGIILFTFNLHVNTSLHK